MALNKLEITGIKFLLAKFRSKSPKGYKFFMYLCFVLAGICGMYMGAYKFYYVPHTTVLGAIYSGCYAIGAALTSAGITSLSTTTDPELASKELVENIKGAIAAGKDLKKN